MAVDTAAKRASVIGLGIAPLRVNPIPDGTIDASDRLHIAWCYNGISVAAPTITEMSLIVTDNADGTVDFTIGDTDGDAVTAYYVSWEDWMQGASWTLAGQRTGDGDISAIATGIGFFVGYAFKTSDKSYITDTVYFRCTDGTDAVQEQFLDFVLSGVQSLSLSGIAAANIVRRKRPWDRDIDGPPSVIISPVDELIDPLAGDNERDITGYGAQVTIYTTSQQDHAASEATHMKWREDVRRKFQNQQPAGVEEIERMTVGPGSVRVPAAFLINWDVQTWTIRGFSRETRL